MNIANFVLEQAARQPDVPAIISPRGGRDRRLTFARLADVSARVAWQLKSAGLKQGDAVLLLVPISPELYCILVALFRAGMVPTVLDPSAGRTHIDRCCDLNPPAGFIGVAKAHLLRLLSGRIRRIPRKLCLGAGWPLGRRLDLDSAGPQDQGILDLPYDAPALLTFTSGSTGLPKAVVRSHGFLLAQHRVLERSIGLRPSDVDLATLPVFVLANFGSGLTTVLPDCDLRRPGWIEPGPVLEQIARHHVTRTAASPAFIERLIESPSAAGQGASLRCVFTGGAPVFPSLLKRIKRVWPDCEPVAVYGSTEAEPIAHLSLAEIAPVDFAAMENGRGLLAGRPVPEIQLAIIASHWGNPLGSLTKAGFHDLQLSAGRAGEIVVSGEHVLRGYLHRQGDAETKFQVDGQSWHRTGDAGYLDPAGRLWLLGRCAARIEDGRGELYPFAAECVAMQFDWVRLAGCAGVGGNRFLALETRREPSSEELERVRRGVEWGCINHVVVLDKLPVDRRHNAKIDYRQLARLLEKELRANPSLLLR